ncbi:MAG: DNA polymerase/3'-5' exonuclease PolX, partial [Bacteroidetes bacterium]
NEHALGAFPDFFEHIRPELFLCDIFAENEMMTNKEIAKAFQYLGNLMELHGENKFKVRSYQNAYIQLRKLPRPLAEMTDEEIGALKGVGKAIASKIRELLDTGTLAAIREYEAKTPEGIRQMLQIKGFGPKKIQVIWRELGVESIGELLYACNENRLIDLKGFGDKTQADLKKKLEYFQKSQGKYHYATLEPEGLAILGHFKKILPDAPIGPVGAFRRKANIVEKISLLVAATELPETCFDGDFLRKTTQTDDLIHALTANDLPVEIHLCEAADFGSKQFRLTGSEAFLKAFVAACPGVDFRKLDAETAVFERAGLPFIAPEMREDAWAVELAKA